MAQQLINIGAAPNDGTGTPLRTSFDYTNQNFTELYTAAGIGLSSNTQVIFNDSGVLKGDAGLVYNKTTDALTVTGPLSTGGTLAVTGATTLTGAATVQGLTVGKGNAAIASNTAFGISALAAVTASSNCTAFGNLSLPALTTGTRNTAVGGEALKLLQSGSNNTAVGLGSLRDVAGSTNTGIGDISLYQLASGDGCTAVGYSAGSPQTAGNNNAFFGSNSYADNSTASNQYNYGDTSVASHKFRAGNVVVNTGNVVMSTAGKGIDFSATASGSGTMTSELLADYEEGTWVPTDASVAGLALIVSECKYTKIGRAVTIQGVIQYPANASGVQAKITGLPFAFVGMAPFSIAYTSGTLVGGLNTVAYLIGHFFDGPLFYKPSASPSVVTTNSELANGTIWFFGTYMI